MNIKHKKKNKKTEKPLTKNKFDIHNVYGQGHGKVHITNINGDRDVLSLQRNRIFQELTEEEANSFVRRLFSYPMDNVHNFENS